MQPADGRKFNDQEVALIIKRAAELQETEQLEQEPANAMTLSEIEQIAREAGIDPQLIRRAAQGLDRPTAVNRPSPWLGSPSRLVFERVVDGEVPVEEFEPLVNEIRRTFGENGVPSVLGRTLAWTSMITSGRRHPQGRAIDVSVTSRGGLTTIRVEEELRILATNVFAPIVAAGGSATLGVILPMGLTVFQSIPVATALWAGTFGGLVVLARTIFGRISGRRERQLSDLAQKLETMVLESIAARPAQVGASSPRTLPSGDATAAAT
jgi:hypothetical protein